MDMPTLLVILLALLALLVVLWWLLGKTESKPGLPFSKRPSLLTPAEMRFYKALLAVLPEGMTVFVKVRLLDVVAVPDNYWNEYGAKGSGMHADFVLADAASAEPRLAIELDDRSHLRPEASERDAFKDAALNAAGVPVLRVKAASRYGREALFARVKERLKG